MDKDTVVLFTRNGIGEGPDDLRKMLVNKFLSVTLESRQFPAMMLFYTDGVKLVCKDSPVLDELRAFDQAGVKMIICMTCLNYFHLSEQVEMGIVGGMGDIVEALARAKKVISL